MICLIDNYDSFSYNLYQLLGSVCPDIQVVRNDAITVGDLARLAPEAIVLSPGPGRPAEAGICEDVVRAFTGKVPILGVCLGHQAICEALGGTITYARQIMHGKSSVVTLDPICPLFAGMGQTAVVGRYHSLEADPDTLPACLRVVSRNEEGEIMAVQHVTDPTFGLQFHPESILTPDGISMVRNFLAGEGAVPAMADE